MRKVMLLAVTLVFAAVLAPGRIVPPPARADLPGGAGCPAAAGTGSDGYSVSATKPAGAAANGVCINLTGTGGENNSAVLKRNPPGCPNPTVGAGSSYVWADWGSTNCVDPGEVVDIGFKSSGYTLEVSAVTWSLAGGGTQDGTADASVSGPIGVGGTFDSLRTDELRQESADSSGGGPTSLYAALAGGLAGALTVFAGGGWYVRRRLR